MTRANRASRRPLRPSLEGLEGRALLSASRPRGAAPAEVAAASRRGFRAEFVANYTSRPGRAEGRRERLFFQGGGSSSAFLHGNLLLNLTTPTDPAAGASATASLFDRNYAETSNVLILDLSGEVGPDGRARTLSWEVGEGSSGSFTRAEGEGSVTILYRGGRRGRSRGAADGHAVVRFRGRLTVDPATNPLLIP